MPALAPMAVDKTSCMASAIPMDAGSVRTPACTARRAGGSRDAMEACATAPKPYSLAGIGRSKFPACLVEVRENTGPRCVCERFQCRFVLSLMCR